MHKADTFRFIQNIAGWTARQEIKYYCEGCLPHEWRYKGINYNVNYDIKYEGFDKYLD